MASGACLCGAVRFEVSEPLTEPDACHCTQCRRQSGHYWASTDVRHDALTVSGEENVRWYQSSERVRRGFCATCGSVLFWDRAGAARIGVGMGAFDAPTGTRLGKHIFVAEKGDYYEISDGVPQIERW
jgi:hypothetical protein